MMVGRNHPPARNKAFSMSSICPREQDGTKFNEGETGFGFMEGPRAHRYTRLAAVIVVVVVIVVAAGLIPSYIGRTATITATSTITVDQSSSTPLNQSTPAAALQLDPPLSPLWTFDEPSASQNVQTFPDIRAFATDNQSVYTVSYEPASAGDLSSGGYYLMRIDLATGATVWTSELPISGGYQASNPVGGIAFSNDSVIVTVADYLLSYSKQGQMNWGSIDNSTLYFPLVHGKEVYTATGIFKVASGKKVCSFQGGEVQAYGHSSVYSMNGTTLSAFDGSTCVTLWSDTLSPQSPGSPSYEYPVYVNGTLFASDGHNIYEISPKSGNIHQVLTLGENIYSPPAVYGNEIYISEGGSPTSCNCSVIAINDVTGDVNWRSFGFQDAVLQPSLNGSFVYVAGGCELSALDAGTGKVAWSWADSQCSGGMSWPPSISDGRYLTAEIYGASGGITTLVGAAEAPSAGPGAGDPDSG
jgi:hypothetical protein